MIPGQQTPWAEDALYLGTRIAERLREQMPELRRVATIDELEGAPIDPRQTPAAVVLLDRFAPAGSDTSRLQALITQEWLVVLAVKSVAAAADRNATKLGPLIPQVVRALQGWLPADAHRPGAWVVGPKPDYGTPLSYFPLKFAFQVVTA